MTEAVIFGGRYQYAGMAIHETGSFQPRAESSTALFEDVFKSHFKSLHAYACTMVKDDIIAEEMVQNVFFKIWERKSHLSITTSLTAYLYRAVYHESLNHIKHQKVRRSYQAFAVTRTHDTAHGAEEKALAGELEQRIQQALQELPEQCRTIFQMSRFEELKYQEIADKLGLSIKTIENQMGKALKLMRLKLVEFLPFIILSLLTL